MKMTILIPIYKTMDAPCVQSLLSMQNHLHGAGHNLKFIFANGFNAARARVGLAREAVEDKEFNADYFLWLDSDHLYDPSAVMKLINKIEEDKLPMLSAAYKLRGGEETVHGITENGKFRHFHYKDFKDMPQNQLIEADIVGFGFLVMRGQFLRDMWAKYGENLFKMDIGMNGTEDVAFCQCAKKDGVKVLFHPQVRVGHLELCVRL